MLVLLVASSTASTEYTITVTPCAANSLRVNVKLRQPSSATSALQRALDDTLRVEGLNELPGAFICPPTTAQTMELTSTLPTKTHGNLQAVLSTDGESISFTRVDTGAKYFEARPVLESLPRGDDTSLDGYLQAVLTLAAGDASERLYGLGQGEWNKPPGGCPSGPQHVVPQARNGQTINLLQTKFHIAVPTMVSSAGYAFVFNMPGYGSVSLGPHGTGGAKWNATAALSLDFWVSGLPEGAPHPMAPLYTQYADATGHAPPLREDAMLFWQSRNRYKSTDIALNVARRYAQLDLPVGILVIDYKNMVHDGDFVPDASCYPSVAALSKGVRATLNATTVFSFWPEVLRDAKAFARLNSSGCLTNRDLDPHGYAIAADRRACRELIWSTYVKPTYFDQGVTAYWLDETDGEGTDAGYDPFRGGYLTQWGPKAFASNTWVNNYISIFTEHLRAQGGAVPVDAHTDEPYSEVEPNPDAEPPLALVRGVWAGGQRYGVVLWSSDIQSNFETLAAMVPQGVHASMSGIPYWTTDVGGYGCNVAPPTSGAYMRELIVRWYQFGLFCPIFRTHGCRNGPSEPNVAPCMPAQQSCGFNEVWSYGPDVQALLEGYVKLRATSLRPYIRELSRNVTRFGVPTMRPLSYEFPADSGASMIDDQYMLGPNLLVAPVTKQGATSREVYFPCDQGTGSTRWESFFDASVVVVCGSQSVEVPAPLESIPVYRRR